jgi:hypothetical protein
MDRIRAQIAADALLQAEMSRALLAIADSLPHTSDPRVVRIVSRTLEASWKEHVSFQHDVVFPIVVARHAADVAETIDRLRAEHAALSLAHSTVGAQLQYLLQNRLPAPMALAAMLRTACELRRGLLDTDAELDGWLPVSFSVAEATLCDLWATQRPVPRFPLNVLRAGGRDKFRLNRLLH